MNVVNRTSPLLIIAAWILVGVPAGWGVYNTALNARKLFFNHNLQIRPLGK